MSQNIEKIIVKYLTQSATASDLDKLSEWIKSPENIKVFKDYVQTHFAINHSMNNPENDGVIEELLQSIRKEKSLVYRLKKRGVFKYATAAILAGILATSYFYRDNLFNISQEVTPVIVNNNIEVGTDKATLTLGDGSMIALEKGKSYQTKNIESNGEQIVYTQKKNSKSVVDYNYLTVPTGGEYFIKLSDGTQVWLNSESQLKYPEVFVEGEDRKVELVYGEAYFDVSPSTLHKGAKFKVFNQSQEIVVIGTEFNVKAYQDETNIYTTLVEGKVDVNIKNIIHSLLPNQQLNLDTSNNTSIVKKVDIYNEISWKDGVFSFRKKPLVEIMRVLSRWYDLDVIFLNPEIKKAGFNGVLGKDQEIEDILLSLKNYGIIKEYKINGKEVVLE